MKAYCVITNECNRHCRYCYYETGYLPRGKTEPSFNVIERRINRCALLGCDSLSITGGEPFIRPSVLLRAVQVAKQNELKVFVPTNGTVLFNRVWSDRELLQLNMIDCLTVSLHIDQALPNIEPFLIAFSDSLRRIQKWFDGRVRINYTVTKQNYRFIPMILPHMNALGISLNLQPVVINETHPLYEEYALPLDWYYKYWGMSQEINIGSSEDIVECEAGKEFFTIQSNGEIIPCFYKPDVRLGNIDLDSLEQLNRAFAQFRNQDKKCTSAQCIVIRSSNRATRII